MPTGSQNTQLFKTKPALFSEKESLFFPTPSILQD